MNEEGAENAPEVRTGRVPDYLPDAAMRRLYSLGTRRRRLARSCLCSRLVPVCWTII